MTNAPTPRHHHAPTASTVPPRPHNFRLAAQLSHFEAYFDDVVWTDDPRTPGRIIAIIVSQAIPGYVGDILCDLAAEHDFSILVDMSTSLRVILTK